MAIDVEEPLSPGWWLARCAKKLEARRPELQKLWDRFESNGPIPMGDGSDKLSHQEFRRKSRTNYAELIVEALRYRMNLIGFVTAVSAGPDGDAEVARLWDENAMEVEFAEMVTGMLVARDGYGIVGFDDNVRRPVITAEDGREIVTIHDPMRQRDIRAAAKLFHDDDLDHDFAYLFLPPKLDDEGKPVGGARRYVASRHRRSVGGPLRFSPAAWDWDDDAGGVDGEELPVSRVPVVRLRNRSGVGEFERHIDLLDRLDERVLEQRVITAMQAYRQRAIEGDLPDRDPVTNEEIDYDKEFEAGPNALWRLPNGVKLWESQTTDITPVLTADDKDVRKLSAVTFTPLYMFSPEAASGSAAGSDLAKEGGVSKARDRCVRAGQGAIDIVSLAFEYLGDTTRSDRSKIKAIWSPPEMRSLAEIADADAKSSLPFGTKLTKFYGLSTTEVELAQAERATDALMADVAAAPVADPTRARRPRTNQQSPSAPLIPADATAG